MPKDLQREPFDAPYLNMMDQINHARVLAPIEARIAELRQTIKGLWPKGHPTLFVHVAGTNGKGSVCKFLEAGFGLLGHAGTITGPHLFDYRERISINGKAVTRKELVSAWEDIVWPLCIERARTHGKPWGYPEINLLLALVVFDRRAVQWAALETGCGGRYDCRMALDVEACVLTNVGDDHRKTLGEELWQRAIEKAGIARTGVPFVTTVSEGEALDAVEQITKHQKAELQVVGKTKVKAFEAELKAAVPKLVEDSLLHAAHQRQNAALALATVTRLKPQVDRAKMVEKIATLSYGGRFHKMADDLYVDVAHNPNKIEALANEITDRLADKPIVFVLGLSGSRLGADVFAPLLPLAKGVVATGPTYKGVPASLLAASIQPHVKETVIVEDNPSHAVLRARDMAAQLGGVVVVTGSMYMIDQALNPDPYVRFMNTHYGWRFPEKKEEALFQPLPSSFAQL